MLPRLLKLALCLTLLLAANSLSAAETSPAPAGNTRIIKWVDEKGVTHYGDRLPPQLAGRDNSEINSQGVVVKRNKPAEAKTGINPELSLQQRQDRALLAAYTTSDEIDLARDRSLQMDQAAIEALNQQKLGVQNRLQANNKTADTFRKRNKPLPADLVQEQKTNQEELAKINQQIAERNASMESTKLHFEQQKRRFTELKSGTAPATTPSAN